MSDWTLKVGLEGSLGNVPSMLTSAASMVTSFGRTVDSGLGKVKTSFAGVRAELGSTLFNAKWARDNEEHLNRVGGAVAGFGATVLAGLGFAAKAAIDWESAWAGVVKTTDATAEELPALEAALRGMTRDLPASHAEIAAVAEAAGQLGVTSKDVIGFTRTMIDLGESTNVTSDAAATAIAQISNVFGEGFPLAEVQNFGSALVELGNNGASTEAQILDIAQRMSGTAVVAGMSVQDVLGFSNAVASVGVNAEVGGSSMSRIMAEMSKAVQTGSSDLELYGQVSEMTAEDFARAWREDPAAAIETFVSGLGRMNAEGGNTMGVLSELGFGAIGTSQVLLSLAGAGDLLANSLEMSGEAWEKNSALAEEAGKRYETTESRLQVAKNQLNEVGISLGSTLLPALANAADGISDVLAWFAALPEPIQRTVTTLGLLVGVAATVGGAMMLLVPRVVALRASLTTLRTDVPKTSTALGKLGKAFSVVGAILAIGQIAGALVNMNKDATEAGETLAGMSNKVANADWDGALANFDTTYISGWGDEISGFKATLDTLLDGGISGGLNRFGQTLNEVFAGGALPSVVADARTDMDNLGMSLADLVTSGNTDRAAEGFRYFAEEAERAGYSQQELLGQLGPYRDALLDMATAQGLALTDAQLLALAQGDLAASGLSASQAADMQTAALEETAASLGMTTEQYQAAAEAADEVREALQENVASFANINGAFTDMLGEGEEAWESYRDGVSVAIDDVNAKLREQVAAQQNWAGNLIALSSTLSSETMAYLQSLGAEGAPLVQQLWQELAAGNTAALEEFDRNTQALVSSNPAALADMMLKATPLIQKVAAEQGQAAADALANALATGQTTVEAEAQKLGLKVESTVAGTTIAPIEVPLEPGEVDAGDAAWGARLQAQAEAAGVTVPVGADTEPAATAVDAYKETLTSSPGAEIPVIANLDQATGATAAFAEYAATVQPIITCDAETGAATLTVDAFKSWVQGIDPTAKVDANVDPATGTVNGFITWTDGSRSEVTVDASTGQAVTKVNGFVGDTNQRTSTVTVGADDSSARGTVNAFTGQSRSTTVKVNADTSGTWAQIAAAIANRAITVRVNASVNAGGGGATLNQRHATGGRIVGRGTGTSDSVPILASNNEHMWTAYEVERVGGHGAMYQIRALAAAGLLTKMLAAIPRRASGGPIDSRPTYAAAPQVIRVEGGGGGGVGVTNHWNIQSADRAEKVSNEVARRQTSQARQIREAVRNGW